MQRVVIFTDGSIKNNGKPNSYGGWAYLMSVGGTVDKPGKTVSGSGGKMQTSNNEMEMTGILMALRSLKPEAAGKFEIHVYSDSQYCVNTFSKWARTWKRMGWRNGSNEVPKNLDMIKEVYELTQKFGVKYFWVKGHVKVGKIEEEIKRNEELYEEFLADGDVAYAETLKQKITELREKKAMYDMNNLVDLMAGQETKKFEKGRVKFRDVR